MGSLGVFPTLSAFKGVILLSEVPVTYTIRKLLKNCIRPPYLCCFSRIFEIGPPFSSLIALREKVGQK